LHDDSSLPSIPEQLQRFANASIVIGPHGAGMVNIVASKRRTCLIEFALINPLTSFMRLSFVLGQNYVDVPLYEENTMVVLSEVKKALHKCLSL
jgi:capsular polysaccharide biosynthesis protein